MNDLEKLLEKIAADLVMVSLDDLPALAGLHEELLKLGGAINDENFFYHRPSDARRQRTRVHRIWCCSPR